MSWESDKEPNCKAAMKGHVERFKNAVLRPWARGHKDRLGIVDLSHAYVNLFVEAARACPYTFGHIVAISAPVAVLAAIFSAVVL